jgi:hypothetical protein
MQAITIPQHLQFDGNIPSAAMDLAGQLAKMEPEKSGLSEWKLARLGKITGSNFNRVTRGRGDKGWSQTAETFMNEIIGEWMTGRPATEFSSAATEWGNEWEPEAIAVYEQRMRRKVVRGQFYHAKGFRLVGCTPDGVGRLMGLEIKCPITPKNHVWALENESVPPEYRDQVNGHILVTERKGCAFVSYHPLMKRKEWKFFTMDVERNGLAIEELSERLFEFEEMLIRRLDRLNIDWRDPNYFKV